MSWLKIEDGSLVNLDHIGSVEMLDMTPLNGNGSNGKEEFHVVLYPADGDADSYKGCRGTKSKCDDYMSSLMDFVDGKEIIAFGERRCNCMCGCEAIIREDFEVCDECSETNHLADYFENLDV